jgi:BirA family biotin operon repressor/biotin-[acetyl-CoA-carboxylase] ligase|tara:strand:- start:126 stop:650 length:525 start_codon:yes stop_codon:yes gene_type:complete
MKLKKFNFKKVKSTNNTAIRLIRRGIDSGVVSANVQTKGKGQRGNKWISKKGNLFISIFFKVNSKLSLKKITTINLSILKKIISSQIVGKIYIKLPNDILIYKKKVSGILQEIMYKNNNKYLIVGIGINIISSPNIRNYPTTYLNKYSKKKINKIKILNKIKLNFEKKYKNKDN